MAISPEDGGRGLWLPQKGSYTSSQKVEETECAFAVIGQLQGSSWAVSFKFLVLEMRSLPP